jgi:hypothetical protein
MIKNNQKLYCINQDKYFENLTELVNYYRSNNINTLEICKPFNLGVGINKKTVSIDEDWYIPELSSNSTIELLLRYKYDGSFLIRTTKDITTQNEYGQFHVYTLSFYMNENVFFSRIFVEIEDYQVKYFLNNKEFQSLKELVDYHKEIPVHNQQTLARGIKSFFNQQKLMIKNETYVNDKFGWK